MPNQVRKAFVVNADVLAITWGQTVALISDYFIYEDLEMRSEFLVEGFYNQVGLVLNVRRKMTLNLKQDLSDVFDFWLSETTDFAGSGVFMNTIRVGESFFLLLFIRLHFVTFASTILSSIERIFPWKILFWILMFIMFIFWNFINFCI